jgi:uncharacterized protein YfaP (DUF2135 family)
MFRTKICVFFIACLISGTVLAGAPEVKIDHPAGGWTSERRVAVKGSVSDSKVQRATLVANGTSFSIRVTNGRFAQNVILSKGPNTISVEASNPDGTGSDSVTFYSKVSKVDLTIYLIFGPQPFYIDLWVTEPDGSKCFWQHRKTDKGGVLHDLYNDLPGGGVGMGPQAYTMSAAAAGEYLIQVNYWAGGSWGQGEVSGGPYGSKRLPIVPFRVEAVLYEGTEQEERHTFSAVLTKPSDTYTAGKIRVRPPDERESAKGTMKGIEKMHKKKTVK